ncbi:phage tail tape measure protein [Yersinia pseudotuberculosis]|nr:phage tail tape measure protein [Yersinia pseudotuberculosis]MBO1563048.1 phage tail tape measure protein [Yersinia pseudotuberculosis]
MADIATISLKVNTSEVERGSNELDKFQVAAAGAAKSADGFGDSGKDVSKITAEVAKEVEETHRRVAEYTEALNKNQVNTRAATQATSEQQQQLRTLLTQINPVTAAFEKLDDMEQRLRDFNAKGMIDPESFHAAADAIQRTRDELGRVAEARTEEGAAAASAAAADKKATDAKEAFLTKLRDQSALYKASASDSAAYRAAQLGITTEAAPLIAAIKQQEEATRRDAEQKRLAAISARGLKDAIKQLGAEERAAAQATKAQENADLSAATAKENFIQRLKAQADLQGKTASEIQAYKAAQLGVTEQAAPFIAKLKEQESAWQNGALSAKQYRLALRQLPSQFTNIATSIAGGMPLWMVVTQQGGRITDSFGGLPGIFAAIKKELFGVSESADESSDSLSENANNLAENADNAQRLVGPMGLAKLGIIGVVAALGLSAVAFYKASREREEFNKQLILTGNYAGRTADQLHGMAKSLSGGGLTQSALSAAMAKVVGTGSFDSSQIEMVTLAAAKMEEATGQSIDATVNNFKRLQNEPLKATKELDDQLHYLTAAEYEQISAMERSGNTIGASRLAMEAYSTAMRERADEVVNNVGYMEGAWNSLKDTAASAWDSMLGVGRPDSMNMQIQSKLKELEAAEKRVALLEKNTPKSVMDAESTSPIIIRSQERVKGARDLVANLKKEYEELNQKSTDDGLAQGRAKAAQDEQTLLKKNLQTREELENKYGNKASQKTVELKKLELDRGVLTVEKYEEYKAVIEKKYADRKATQPKAYQDDLATRELLDSQARVAALKEQSNLTDTMTDQENRLLKFTQKIADLKSKTILTADQKSLLFRASEITASIQLEAQLSRENVERKKATEALKKMEEYTASIVAKNKQNQDRFGLTSKQAGRVDQETQLDNTFRKDTKGINDAEQLAKITAEYNKAKAELHAGFEQEDLNEGNWLAGMTQGLEQYGETANNVFSATAQLAQTTMGSMTSMANQMMTTGSANVKQFATNFMSSIVDIINKLLLAQMIQTAMGWIGGAVSGGNDPGAVPMGLYNGGYVPEFAGGGYTGEGGKFEPKGVVHGGEFVFTKEATNRIGIDNLYKMMRGYADGGVVSNAVTATAPMLGMQGGETVISVDLSGMTITTQGNQQQDTGANNGELVSKAARNEVIAIVTQQLDRAMGQSGRITNFVTNRAGR